MPARAAMAIDAPTQHPALIPSVREREFMSLVERNRRRPMARSTTAACQDELRDVSRTAFAPRAQ